MKSSSPMVRAILLIAVIAVIGSSIVSVSQQGWTFWGAAALVCAVAVVIALLFQTIKARKRQD